MVSNFVEEDLPAESITVDGKTWVREKFDTNSYQWIRQMSDDEYDWDVEEDNVSLVGTEVPIRVVSLQLQEGEWTVEGAETAGPDYHRPGFTELISGEFTETFDDAGAAFEAVKQYIRRLS